MLPVASGLVAKGQGSELKDLYRSTTKWLFIFTLPLFLTFFFFPSQIMRLAFGGDYPTAARALQLLCLGDFVHTFLGPNATTLVAYGRSRFIMMAAIIATVTNIILNLILTPRWGITGAATASFIALILINIITSIYLFRRYRIHPFGANYLKPVVILVVVSAALYLPLREMLDLSCWLLLAYYPLLLALSLTITYLSRSLEPMDRVLIKAARQRLRSRKRFKRTSPGAR
jgi:O-antigen/teichoic acid export membrane protein